MISLRALLAQCGILLKFDRALDNLDVPEAKIKQLQRQIANLVLDAVVKTGKTVVDDFEQ